VIIFLANDQSAVATFLKETANTLSILAVATVVDEVEVIKRWYSVNPFEL
jgi:hypothetical protein